MLDRCGFARRYALVNPCSSNTTEESPADTTGATSVCVLSARPLPEVCRGRNWDQSMRIHQYFCKRSSSKEPALHLVPHKHLHPGQTNAVGSLLIRDRNHSDLASNLRRSADDCTISFRPYSGKKR
jgi:hypothetical protein